MAKNPTHKNLAAGETLEGADDEPTEQNTDPNPPADPQVPTSTAAVAPKAKAQDPAPEPEPEDQPAVLPPRRKLDRTQPFAENRGPNGLESYEQRGALYDLQGNRKD